MSIARTIAPVPSQVVGSLRPVRYQLTLSRIVRCWSGEKLAAWAQRKDIA